LPFNQVLNFDVVVGILSMLLLWVFLIMSGQRTLRRWHGGVFVVMYVAYIAFLVS